MVALFALLISACEGPAAVPIAASDDDPALVELEAVTGHAWTLRRNPILHTPAFLEGRTEPMAATPRDADRAAREFLSRWHALFQMSSPDVELATVSSVTDELGMTHTRYVQRVSRVPVWGGDLAVHFAADGSLLRINGRYAPIVAPDSLTPSITSDAARVEGAVLARSQRPTADPSSVSTRFAELILFPVEHGALPANEIRPARLAWRVVADVVDVDPPLELEAIFDAIDGSLLAAQDLIQRVEGTGVGVFGDRKPLGVTKKKTAYWLEDDAHGGALPSRTYSANGHYRLPGSELRSLDPNRWDATPEVGVAGAAVDAHAYVAASWDYFRAEHGRAGWANNGAGIRTTVHYGSAVAGAFFDGDHLFFGDGDRNMTAPAAAFDIVAHEYTHGVIAASAGLQPSGEPGAIGEGLADLFGCLIAWNSGEGARWQIGETVYHPYGLHRAIRDLADPRSTGQPTRLDEIVSGADDQGGVHANASIVGHLGYLLVEGDGASIPALGTGPVGRLFYRALTAYLFPHATFADLADALLAASRDLGGGLEGALLPALATLGLR